MTDILISVAPEDPDVVDVADDLIITQVGLGAPTIIPLADDMTIVPHVNDPLISVRPNDLSIAVSDIGPQGPAGPPGVPGTGDAGSVVVSEAVNQPLGGNRVVRAVTGGVDYASSDVLADADAIVGFTQAAAMIGQPVTVQTAGPMTEPGWDWIVGQPVYCGLNGVPTQTVPSSGFMCRVGKATSATSILINVEEAIILA